jgi:hypothetical protein
MVQFLVKQNEENGVIKTVEEIQVFSPLITKHISDNPFITKCMLQNMTNVLK